MYDTSLTKSKTLQNHKNNTNLKIKKLRSKNGKLSKFVDNFTCFFFVH